MSDNSSASLHTWLVMMKAHQAIVRYILADLEETGLGASDFQVLEVLLHKGPLPVNVIGPKVNLTPGSISVAVDRLVAKGLVSRVESASDRRIRMVELTPHGKSVIKPIFKAHVATIEKIFAKLSQKEIKQLEQSLRSIGLEAEELLKHSDAEGQSKK